MSPNPEGSPSSGSLLNSTLKGEQKKTSDSVSGINDFRRLASFFTRVEIGRGVVWNIGDSADELYIVESGQLELSVKDKDRYHVIETSLYATMIGELEVFSNQTRACKLVATTDSILWKMTREKVWRGLSIYCVLV
jgi:CRP-like cAMP-binding protein